MDGLCWFGGWEKGGMFWIGVRRGGVEGGMMGVMSNWGRGNEGLWLKVW